MPASPLVGSRIRERRSVLGLKQAELAKRAGISPSYLNLIEHNRRRIGGRVLLAIARALDVEVPTLSDGAEAALLQDLRAAAALEGGAEVERAEEFAGRFPGWAGLVSHLLSRVGQLEKTVDSLSDRMTHDPFLAESLHEVLSTISGIRSTAAILSQTDDIPPVQRGRFMANIHDGSRRLSETAQGLADFFDRLSDGEQTSATPFDEVNALWDRAGHRFEALEAGQATVHDILQAAPEIHTEAAFQLGMRQLGRYRDEARSLPHEKLRALAITSGFDAGRIASATGLALPLVMRRMASLATDDQVPPIGIMECDNTGTTTFRRAIPGFSVPRYGAGCNYWPLYRALSMPGTPLRVLAEHTDGTRFRLDAVAGTLEDARFDLPVTQSATMLIFAASESAEKTTAIGTSCRICPRTSCGARREPSILG